MKITLDFETRSRFDLKKGGAFAYAEHPSTEILCAAVKIDDDAARLWAPQNFREMLPAGHVLPMISDTEMALLLTLHDQIEAHNAGFELAMISGCARRLYPWWPEPQMKKWSCSMAKCAYHAIPMGLGNAAAVLNLPVQKDAEGHRLMLKMCKPRKARKKEREQMLANGHQENEDGGWIHAATGSLFYLWHELPDDLLRLFQYCIQDVETEHLLSNALTSLPRREQEIWQLDQEINARGVYADLPAARVIIKETKAWEELLLADYQDVVAGIVSSPKQVAATRKYLESLGVFIDDMAKATVTATLADSEIHEDARRILEIRASLGKSSVSKYVAITNAACQDSRIRGLFMYHAASTGRWGGRLLQPQNLPRGTFSDVDACVEAFQNGGHEYVRLLWGDPMSAASTCVRPMLVAAPGKELLVADFSSVEARVLGWLAQEPITMTAFLEGKDLYKVAAESIFGVPYEKVTKSQRQVGKTSELALGYNGGIGAYAAMAKNYGINLEELPQYVFPLADEELMDRATFTANEFIKRKPDEMSGPAAIACDIIKRLWRAKRPNIVAFWRKIEETAGCAVNDPGATYEYLGVRYKVHASFLKCLLPSGRVLHYFESAVKPVKTPWGEEKLMVTHMGTNSVTHQWERQVLTGGRCTENIVQALSRDLLCDSMLRVERAGYPIVMHVHDEIVSEVPEGDLEHTDLGVFENLVAEVPAWAAGLPLRAEGYKAKRYRK